MARATSEEQRRALLLEQARQLLGPGPGEVVVIVARGDLEVIRQEAEAPAPLPAGVSAYDAAILGAIGDRPRYARYVAAASGHPYSSYFRTRLAALVEAGHVRRTRRGYSRQGS